MEKIENFDGNLKAIQEKMVAGNPVLILSSIQKSCKGARGDTYLVCVYESLGKYIQMVKEKNPEQPLVGAESESKPELSE